MKSAEIRMSGFRRVTVHVLGANFFLKFGALDSARFLGDQSFLPRVEMAEKVGQLLKIVRGEVIVVVEKVITSWSRSSLKS